MTPEETKKRALRLLEKRDYSRGELIAKLMEKGAEENDAIAVVDRLVELRFINDESYAAMIVRHYAAKGFGAARIREELRRRRIPREMWDAALSDLPDSGETVYALLTAKLRSDAPDRDELRRASDALRRRGFTWEQVRGAIERFNTERNSDT
ncbi:MAG: regulatory protein RecX [Oscillospiraceae bacterium]